MNLGLLNCPCCLRGESCPPPTGQLLCAIMSFKPALRRQPWASSHTFLLCRGPSRSCTQWDGCSTSWISPCHRDGCISSLISAVELLCCAALYRQLAVWLLQWYCTPAAAAATAGQSISLPGTMSKSRTEEKDNIWWGMHCCEELYWAFSSPKVTEEVVEGNDMCHVRMCFCFHF